MEIEPVYRTSSFCSGGDCVEVGITTTDVLVRDTKDRSRPELVFPPTEWAAFVAGMQAGEL